MIGTTWQIYPLHHFENYASEWDSLNRLCTGLPVLSAESIRALIKHYGSNQRLAVCYADLGVGERNVGVPPPIIAITFIERAGFGRWQTWQPSQIPVTLLVRDPAGITLHEIAEQLVRAISGCLLLGITQIDPMLMGRPDDNARRSTMDYIETSRILMTGSFSDYWDGRGSNLKQNLGKQRRRLEKNKILPRLEIVSDPEKIVSAVNDYARLESLSWKSAGGTALEPGNQQCLFYADWLTTLSRKREAFAAKFHFGERLVACDLCVIRDGTLIILKTTYDEAERSTSPALMLLHDLLSKMWPELRCVEFYGRTADWHRQWCDDTRVLYHITMYRCRWLRALSEASSRWRRRATDAPLMQGGPPQR